MTNIEQRLKKLEFQVARVGSTVSRTDHPVDALILEMDWSKENLETAMKIFEKHDRIFSQEGVVSPGQFETDFREALGVGHDDLISVVLALYREHHWTNVCKAYKQALGSPPALREIR